MPTLAEAMETKAAEKVAKRLEAKGITAGHVPGGVYLLLEDGFRSFVAVEPMVDGSLYLDRNRRRVYRERSDGTYDWSSVAAAVLRIARARRACEEARREAEEKRAAAVERATEAARRVPRLANVRTSHDRGSVFVEVDVSGIEPEAIAEFMAAAQGFVTAHTKAKKRS